MKRILAVAMACGMMAALAVAGEDGKAMLQGGGKKAPDAVPFVGKTVKVTGKGYILDGKKDGKKIIKLMKITAITEAVL